MSKDTELTNEILKGLEPMFREAERTGKWFCSTYQGVWFSPEELRGCHSEGKFLWSAENWVLLDPTVAERRLEASVVSATIQLEAFRKRMQRAKLAAAAPPQESTE